METKETMDNEKKVYTPPKLVEHGILVEMTQENSFGPYDDNQGSTANFIIMP